MTSPVEMSTTSWVSYIRVPLPARTSQKITATREEIRLGVEVGRMFNENATMTSRTRDVVVRMIRTLCGAGLL